jgi:hypothetical protein
MTNKRAFVTAGFVAQISIIWDSRHESSVIAGVYGQLDT